MEGQIRNSKFSKDQEGAAYLETAISLLVFLSLIFMSIDILQMAYHTVNAQFIVTTALRESVIGPGRPLKETRLAEIKATVKRIGKKYNVNLNDSNIRVCSVPANNCTFQDPLTQNGGGPQSLVSLSIRYQFKLLNIFSHEIAAEAIGRNEPFSIEVS